jgi:hypothetical protein
LPPVSTVPEKSARVLKTLGQKTVYPMKALYTTLFTLLLATGLMANTITAKADGAWGSSNSWNPAATPVDGDTIIIPAGITVTVDNNNQYSFNNVVIIVYGVLDLDKGKLKLDEGSRFIIPIGGKLTGHGSNDQLRLGNDIVFKGSQGVQAGPTFTDSTTNGGWANLTLLPVTFQSFYVTRMGANIQLSWSTSAEANNAYYAIEKSTDARSWKQVAVIPGAGTSAQINKYDYTDKNSTDAIVYYRIRQVDINGTSFYSAIRSLRNNENSQAANIYASSNKTVIIDFNSDVKDNVYIQVINMSGQVIVRKEFSQASYRLVLDATGAGSGVYAVRVSDSKGWSEVKKIAL